MFYDKYVMDNHLSKCGSEKIVKLIKTMSSTLISLVDFLIVPLFLILGNIVIKFLAPYLLNLNILTETQLINFMPHEAVFYTVISHLLLNITIKLCFIFITSKAMFIFVKFFVCAFLEKKEEFKNNDSAVVGCNSAVSYKLKVQYLN